MRTYMAKKGLAERRWYVVDASDKVLGRLATRLADLLRGKGKPVFTPQTDTGDFVVVVNAEKVRLTGNKWQAKVYYRHSGYPGGLKEETAEKLRRRRPEQIVRRAVRGMLPKNRLSDRLIQKLKVYAGPAHPHRAQKPEPLAL
ncbi:MAG: 50S ribosomal protein L13 [Deltaproteobacteria bacterium]|nr:50S ribosomal protein L13 [Deltaproteobacteria bacterium]